MGGRIAVAVVLLSAAACGGNGPPSYRTSSGMRVWDPAGHFTAAEVEHLSASFLDELETRWPPGEARRLLARAEVEFLDVHTYESWGRTVAGTTDPDTLRITVAARDYRLSSSALAHELVHYVDLGVSRDTDFDHESWKVNGTYDALERVKGIMRLYEEGPAEVAR